MNHNDTRQDTSAGAFLERAFRVRHYECDAYGHVNHANYLRYMQEAAMDASAAVGYDVERYGRMGRQWLIRETDITYLRPLVYGDTVIVKTWVGDFRRVRSRRLYELRLAGSGEPVATASTEWVYLDTETSRPATVPPEMVAAFWHPQTAAGERREPFPPAPSPPPGIVRVRRRVEWRDIDPAQHVNNANYLTYIEECNVAAAAAYGWPLARIMERGVGIVAHRYRIEYREPAVMDDELEVTSYLADVRRATAVRHNEIRRTNDGALLARCYALWVFIDLATGSPRRIPLDFLESFRPNVAESINAHQV
jgi:acyl-CoA thioester hydrolase